MFCRVCQCDVPAGEFCGLCGVRHVHRRQDGPDWLRISAYSAASDERLWTPALTSSIFPQLSTGARGPFRLAVIGWLVAVVLFGLLRMPATLIAVATLGLPLLFVLSLWEAGAHQDLPRRTLALTAVLGIGLGVGWALLTGAVVARSYGVPLQSGIAVTRLLQMGIGIPAVGALLTLVPAVVVRLMRPSDRESLDGFMIGALGALSFTAAGTLTRLTSQLSAGLVNRERPVSGLLVEAGIRGVAVPVCATAVGGLIGTALWFTRSPGKADRHTGLLRLLLTGAGLAVLGIYVSMGMIDIRSVPQWIQLGCYLAVAALAVLLLRIGLQLALLHEAQEEAHPDQPILCPECGKVVPDMGFCSECGAATRASPRSSRIARRDNRPSREADVVEAAAAVLPGHGLAPGDYAVQPLSHTSFRRLSARWLLVIGVVAVALGALSVFRSEPPTLYSCPPNCGRPPTGKPVAINPRFAAVDGAFSMSYPAEGAAYRVTRQRNGVTAELLIGDGGTLQLFSEPARGRDPREIAQTLVRNKFPDTKTAYVIPNTMVGYQPGYGEVVDYWPQGANASAARMRVMVMVAVKDDLALVAGAVGPYHEFGPDFGPGPPSGANLEIAEDMGKYVNSFSWRGDPPR